MDELLLIAHSRQAMNLFDESFLAIIQVLLECPELEMQRLATESFIKFAYIEEETPSYHRRYDFLISKFASMCLTHERIAQNRKAVRLAGIKGLQAVIQKTASDDLVVNVWDEDHMHKIVNAILHLMHSSHYRLHCSTESQISEDEPGEIAEECLLRLFRIVSFGQLIDLLAPILRYLDSNVIWSEHEFCVYLFHKMLLSIQPSYSCVVFETLVLHLDENINESNKVLNAILGVLYQSIIITSQERICSYTFEIVNLLINHLKKFLFQKQESEEYANAVEACLLELHSRMPNSQKMEIIVFLSSKVPISYGSRTESILQRALMGSALSITKTMNNMTMDMRKRLPRDLLTNILPLCKCLNIFNLVQGIFHILLDRQGYFETLRHPGEHGKEIYEKLVEALSLPGNTPHSLSTFYTTFALIAVELVCESTISEYISAVYNIQEIAVSLTSLASNQKVFLLCMSVKLIRIAAYIVENQSLAMYCKKLIELRKIKAPYLLTGSLEENSFLPNIDNELLLNKNTLELLLRHSGMETRTPIAQKNYWIHETSIPFFAKEEVQYFNNTKLQPPIYFQESNKSEHTDAIAFESIKSTLNDNKVIKKEQALKDKKLNEFFRTKPFKEIIHTYTNEDCLQSKVNMFLNEITSPNTDVGINGYKFEMEITELFPEIGSDY